MWINVLGDLRDTSMSREHLVFSIVNRWKLGIVRASTERAVMYSTMFYPG